MTKLLIHTATCKILLLVDLRVGEQWRSYARSWLQRQRWSEGVKGVVGKLFEKYCPDTLDFVERQCKLSVQVYGLQIVASLCNMVSAQILDSSSRPQKQPADDRLAEAKGRVMY